MKHAATLAHIRQLCSLGLKPEEIMPAFLKALHDLVPSDSNAFFWIDDNSEITNICAERVLPADVMQLYFRKFYVDQESNFKHQYRRLAQSPQGVAALYLGESFYRSDYYNLVWRDLNAHHALYAAIGEHGDQLGQLSLYRAAKDPLFTPKRCR
jgi:hypothetical protein